MARTASDIVIDADAARIMDVIADFDSYPSWATGVRSAEVTAEGAQRPERVHFVLDASPIKDEYELSYTWQGDEAVSWHLSEKGSMLTAMDGSYELEPADGGTRVTYRLAVEVAVPLLGMLKRKAEKVIIDTALTGLKRRVERDG
ncbi:SRPBCC family protein [Aeromicrobium halocynthiae]|uniref:SRPBCC family protein n=1 Tax=Aeromicrobium halocynthiae TaxID=560557 RepID=A0ABN2VSE1_9ACTN